MQANSQPTLQPKRALAPVGYALGALSLLAILALLHHPISHGRDPADILASIRAQTTVDQLVHGALTAIYSLFTAAMVLFAARLGPGRFMVSLGLVTFFGAMVFIALAALNDGFAIPVIAAQCAPKPSPSCDADALILLRMSALQVEFLTRFSFSGIAIAVIAWSAALLTSKGVPKWAGLIGLASGGSQLLGLFSASARLRPDTLLEIFAAQVVWYLVVAALMIQGTGPFADGVDGAPRNEPSHSL